MALSVVQSTTGAATGFQNTVVSTAFGSTTVAGHTIVVIANNIGNTTTGVTDSFGNTYVLAKEQPGTADISIWVSAGIATGGASHTVTATGTGSTESGLIAYEIIGVVSSVFCVDGTSIHTGTTTSMTSGTTVTTNANDILIEGISVASATGTWTPDAAYSNFVSVTPWASGYELAAATKIVSSTGSYTSTVGNTQGAQTYGFVLIALSDTLIPNAPTVTTQAESSVSDVTATGNGNITSLGSATPDHRGVVYSTSTQSLPGNVAPGSSGYSGNVDATGSFSTGAFTSSMTGLSPSTTYFVRAYAHNSVGYSYGAEVSFTTLSGLPTVTTQAATVTGETTATGNGNQTVLGTSTTTEEGMVWSTSTQSLPGNVAPGSSGYSGTAHASGSFGTGAYTQSITGLTKNTTYFARAYVRNTTGYAYGGEVSFTTNPGTPLIDAISDLNLGFTDDITGNADDKLLLEDGVSRLLLEDGTSKLVINYSYPQNDYVTYTPAADVASLNASTVYYWRVRQRVSGGGFGPWSETRSFTTAASAPSGVVAQIAANLVLTPGTQVVVTSNIVSVAQVSANLVLSPGTQAVATSRFSTVAQVGATLTLNPGTQAVASVRIVSIAQVGANLVLTGGTEVVATTNFGSVAQVSANLVLTGGTQVPSIGAPIAQVSANLVLNPGTQAVASSRIAAVTQVSANLVLSPGTQAVNAGFVAVIAQIGATLTLTPGTQAVSSVQKVALAQAAANLVLTAGTQAVAAARVATVAQISKNLVLTPGTQAFTAVSSSAIAQIAANLILSPGTEVVIGQIVGGLWWWNGVAWVPKAIKVWNGTSWVIKPLKKWTGSSWVAVTG